MILKKQLKPEEHLEHSDLPPACALNFGLSGLNNISFVEQFFPQDLPEEWRLDYYSNEFELLLIHCSDLIYPSDGLSQKDINSQLIDEIIDQLSVASDELGDELLLFFDLSIFPEDSHKQFYEHTINTDNHCHFVNFKQKLNILELPAEAPLVLEWGNLIVTENSSTNNHNSLFCKVFCERKAEPVELRRLIEHLRKCATIKNYKTVNVVFSSESALENCRDAILLERMM